MRQALDVPDTVELHTQVGEVVDHHENALEHILLKSYQIDR